MEKYNMIRYLNKGSYGKIYLIQDKRTKEQFALKSIKIFGIDRYNKVSILNEIKILLINESEFLLKCHDLFISNRKLCIVTEFIDGGDLDNYIKKNKLMEEEIIKIFLKICVGIESLHQNAIIHRDIKPANILITKNGNIKICDFGICKFLNFNKVTNTSIGTPFFMSPEQMTEQYYDYKIDVWGIGCVLFYLLYNKYPFGGNNIHQLKNNIRYQNPLANIKSRFPFIPTNNLFRIEQILREMFEKNKQKRLNLSVFLDNSKELLQYYKINRTKSKFRQYQFKSVPNTERDWNNIIKQTRDDFRLGYKTSCNENVIIQKQTNNTEIVKTPQVVNNDSIIMDKKPQPPPKIKTFAEIKNKRYNISPMKPLPPVVLKPTPPQYPRQNPPQYPRQNPPQYPRQQNHIRPSPKIYIHQKRRLYNDTLNRIKMENRIKERHERILEQQNCINQHLKQPKSSIVLKKKTPLHPVPPREPKIVSRYNAHLKNRLKNVESKIKHIWAPNKTLIVQHKTPHVSK